MQGFVQCLNYRHNREAGSSALIWRTMFNEICSTGTKPFRITRIHDSSAGWWRVQQDGRNRAGLLHLHMIDSKRNVLQETQIPESDPTQDVGGRDKIINFSHNLCIILFYLIIRLFPSSTHTGNLFFFCSLSS